VSAAATAASAAREAAARARAASGDPSPKLAVVFVSPSYPDAASAGRAVRDVVGDAQIIGGTAGACVFGAEGVEARGVSVVLLGGDDVEVVSRTGPIASSSLLELVPAAAEVARAADLAEGRGFGHFTCLVFAPGLVVDGDALVAAVRKGAGARAQLAGALTGDDLTLDRTRALFGDELRDDCAVITGIFTRRPVGIAARHGWSAVGPVRQVTRADGELLVELDGRPALDVWLEDARAAGASPPPDRSELALYLANHYEIGIADGSAPPLPAGERPRELVARAPFAIRDDGAVKLSACVGEGARVRVIHGSEPDLLRASREAAASAIARAGSRVVGALVLSCTGRLVRLGDAFAEEPAGIHRCLEAPIGGACVFGEIARNVRDADAFFNTTAVVVAFAV